MKRNLKIILALLLALALVFCAACTKDEPAQEPQEGTETENRDNPDATGSGAAPSEPEPAPDPYAEYNAEAEKAFLQVVQNYVVLGELPGFDQDIPYSEYADGEWTNMYAILDIDGDGRNELVLRIAQTIMASMQENIYAYDEETGEIVQELWAFPLCTYLRGGLAIQSGWSHGTGAEGPDFWPFNVFYYNEETDEYDLDGYCAQISLEAMKEIGWEDRFPAEYDKDGDGIIYEISNETTGDLEWVDEDGYQFWYNNLFGDEPPLDIPWKTLDEFVHPNG
ncbi:MAG: hypothetical protein IJQ41_05270 [Firmicutes bacterium]|nr:hypothetical protein [Bacillota bacterium]MBQ6295254.1 hypothetical protein [Bacillota bacterium]MBR0052229.1 hypothetical protein [Bacillota bacterium]MBR0210134.1 hypothetical protein [Bacillota bacterium]MBR0517515.1 hypothetical protein [Bacillota bacterium]